MSNYSTSNEVAGTNFLTGAVIASTFFLLIAVLAQAAPQPVKTADAAPAQAIAASANTGISS